MPVRNRCGISETCTSRSGSYHPARFRTAHPAARDRKSTRLNSSHDQISYAVFCLKKKKTHMQFLLFASKSTLPMGHDPMTYGDRMIQTKLHSRHHDEIDSPIYIHHRTRSAGRAP